MTVSPIPENASVDSFALYHARVLCLNATAGASAPEQLETLMGWLSALQEGGTLDLRSNPWKEPPEAVVKKGMVGASEFFADLYAEGATIRLNMIKVVLVGQQSAGKTR